MVERRYFSSHIRSFVRRDSRRLSGSRQRALRDLWPVYGIDFRPRELNLHEVFLRSAPLVVEIGAGGGDVVQQHAGEHPENDYLLLEMDRSCIGQALLRMEQHALRNVRVINHDAVEVFSYQLPAGSVDLIFVFFPDPWPKTRHHKRRLLQMGFLRWLAAKLTESGRIFIATDWPDYARHITEVFEHSGLFVSLAGRSGLVPRPVWRFATKYEKRGHKLRHEIFEFCYIKKNL